MTQSFDDFKKYHNANYHDGSSHFDEQIYKKSNGDDFDCSFVQDCYDHFEAGAASRQTEIDNLKQSHHGASIGRDVFIKQLKERHKAEIKLLEKEIIETQEFLNNQNHIKQAKIDELQKRIDVYEKHIAVIKHIHENEFNEDSDTSWILGNLDGFFECLNEDLKGKQND